MDRWAAAILALRRIGILVFPLRSHHETFPDCHKDFQSRPAVLAQTDRISEQLDNQFQTFGVSFA